MQAKEAALTSVGCIADCIRESFVPFYGTFVGIAKSLLASCVGKEYATMRGKALQCVSLIIAAVGREVAGTDSAEMLNQIVRAVAVAPEVAEDDADGFDFMIMSIVRIADTLGADFVPYLQFVMPILFQHASKEVDVTVLDVDGPGDEDDDDEEEKGVVITDVNMPGIGKRKLAINPSKLSTKLAAMSGLVSLIEDLGVEVAGFRPFILPATKVFVSFLAACSSCSCSGSNADLVFHACIFALATAHFIHPYISRFFASSPPPIRACSCRTSRHPLRRCARWQPTACSSCSCPPCTTRLSRRRASRCLRLAWMR